MGITRKRVIAVTVGTLALSALAACDANGKFNFGEGLKLRSQDEGGTAPATGRTIEEDVEAPEVFSVTDEGLWDGRPSLGGIWVAHPDVTEPERVIIRNSANGRSVVGALFRRERDVPGPLLQISSDAAAELGLVAGQPQELQVTALRRREVPVAAAVTDSGSVAPPAEVTETALDPVAIADDAVASTPDPDAVPDGTESN